MSLSSCRTSVWIEILLCWKLDSTRAIPSLIFSNAEKAMISLFGWKKLKIITDGCGLFLNHMATVRNILIQISCIQRVELVCILDVKKQQAEQKEGILPQTSEFV